MERWFLLNIQTPRSYLTQTPGRQSVSSHHEVHVSVHHVYFPQRAGNKVRRTMAWSLGFEG